MLAWPGQKPFTLFASIVVLAVVLLTLYLSWRFANVILLSLVGAYILRPLDKTIRKIGKVKNRQASATITISLVALAFLAVFSNILFTLGSELSKFQPATIEADVNSLINYILSLVSGYIPASMQAGMKENFASSASGIIIIIINTLQGIVLGFLSNLAFFAVEFVVVIFLIYYLLIDGENILSNLTKLVPSEGTQVFKEFLHHLDNIYHSLFNVYLVVCILTGVIASAGLMILGFPYPLMWGTVIAVLALLPLIGPGTFYIPATIYYIIIDEPFKAVILLIFGWLFLDTIPGNVLRPRLMMQKGQIHPIITLLSFTAPLFVIGPIGIILGPASYGFLLAVYRTHAEKQRTYSGEI